MRQIRIAGAWLLAALAACDGQRGAAPAVIAPIEQGQGRVEWNGMQPCADCEGIETRLVLTRDGRRRNFVLSETYLAERPVSFVAGGQWQRQRDLLQLHAEDGSRLSYALLADGRLQPRDGRGRRLATSDGDGLLMPATAPVRR